jgi:phospholipid transport system substrate-binding protein
MRTLKTLVLSGLVALSASAFAAGGPLATLKAKNGEVDKLLRVKTSPGTPEEKKVKDEIKSLAGTLFDYNELAKKALAEHWDKLTAAQRTEFVATLKGLIERNYTRQLSSNMDYQVVYKDEQTAGQDATVTSVVKVKTKGKATDAEIVYKMRKPDAAQDWLVWDVITDEVSLVRNYRTQFAKIINEKGYDELIHKMKTKLDDKGSDKEGNKK